MVVGNTQMMSGSRVPMRFPFKRSTPLTIAAFVLVTTASQILSAEEDLVHIVSGVVKHVDKDTKTMVVKTCRSPNYDGRME